jgi:hypothetical protein
MFAMEYEPVLEEDWNLQFNRLDGFSKGGGELALKHFEAHYLGEKLIEQINFIQAHEDALSRNKDIILWAERYDEKNKPLFGLILDLPGEMLSSIFLNNDVRASIRYAAKIYLCKKFEKMLFHDSGRPDCFKFLNIFSGDFYLKDLAEHPGKSYIIKLENAARFFILMCELFDEKCVKNAVLSKISVEEHSEVFGKSRDVVDLRVIAVLVALSKTHAEERSCVVQ